MATIMAAGGALVVAGFGVASFVLSDVADTAVFGDADHDGLVDKIQGAATGTSGVRMGGLAKAPTGRWFGLDTADMPTPLEKLDPVLLYPWARAFARAYAPDAGLTRMHVRHAPMDGRPLDLVSDDKAEVDIRFTSRVMNEAWERLKEVSEEPMYPVFRLNLGEGDVEGMKADHPELPTGDPELGCAYADLMKALGEAGIDKQPYVDLWLRPGRSCRRHEDRDCSEWVWSAESAEIDARTCDIKRRASRRRR